MPDSCRHRSLAFCLSHAVACPLHPTRLMQLPAPCIMTLSYLYLALCLPHACLMQLPAFYIRSAFMQLSIPFTILVPWNHLFQVSCTLHAAAACPSIASCLSDAIIYVPCIYDCLLRLRVPSIIPVSCRYLFLAPCLLHAAAAYPFRHVWLMMQLPLPCIMPSLAVACSMHNSCLVWESRKTSLNQVWLP